MSWNIIWQLKRNEEDLHEITGKDLQDILG